MRCRRQRQQKPRSFLVSGAKGRGWKMRRCKRSRHGFLKGIEGATAVEFGIVLPVLLLILLGIMDFGNLYYQLHNVNEASRAGARYASVDQNLASIPTDVSTFITTNYGSQLTVNTTPTPLITNSVKALIIGVFFTSNPYTLTGKCTMQLEN
jgi:Flp pilus assembly protein TadG